MADDLRERGLRTRREVLGDDAADSARWDPDSFEGPFRDLFHRMAWGEVWNRPGLDRRSRSLVTVALMIALGKPDELRTHLRGALRGGVTKDELRELFLHAAVYCGAPAANVAYRAANEVLAGPGDDR